MGEELKLFRTWSSRFALRVVHALKIKGLEYETIFEDLSNKSDSLLKYNPVNKKVPVLVHNGKPICESLVILEYIDETWKQCPLLPKDPYEKAKARFWAKFGDDKGCNMPRKMYLGIAKWTSMFRTTDIVSFIQNMIASKIQIPLNNTHHCVIQLLSSIWNVFITHGKEQEELIAAAVQNLKLLEEQLKDKKFFGGETIGYLDIAFGWMANLISIWGEMMDLKLVDEEKFPLLSAWMQNFSDDPVIKECWPPRDRMIVKFQIMLEPYLKTVGSQ